MLCGHKLAPGFSLDPSEDPITAVDVHLQEQKLSLVLFSCKPFVSKISTTNIYLLSTFFYASSHNWKYFPKLCHIWPSETCPWFSNEPEFCPSLFVYLCGNTCCLVLCLARFRIAAWRVGFNSYTNLCLWFQLKTIETLLGNTSKVGEVIVLGMITQLKEVGCCSLRNIWVSSHSAL